MDLHRFDTATESEGVFRPQLTSLIDVMTILLVFLIKSFSVEGNLVTPSPDLELARSESDIPPRPAPTLEITHSAVISEGVVISPIPSFIESDSLLIPELYKWMQTEKARSSSVSGVPAARVLIQSDRTSPFNVLKRVLYTCSNAGFSDFTVLVIEEE